MRPRRLQVDRFLDTYGDMHRIRLDVKTGEFSATVDGAVLITKDLPELRRRIQLTVDANRISDWKPVIIVYAHDYGWRAGILRVWRYYRTQANKDPDGPKYIYRKFVPECRHFLHPWAPEDHPGEEHPDVAVGIGEHALFPRRGCWPHAPGEIRYRARTEGCDIIPYSHDAWRRLEALRLCLQEIRAVPPKLLGDNLQRTLAALADSDPVHVLLHALDRPPADKRGE